MWLTTNSSPHAWVETGILATSNTAVLGHTCGVCHFWAEQNTVGSYAAHWVQSDSLGTNYDSKISYSGSGRWTVYLGGGSIGESSANHASSVYQLSTGTEISTDGALVSGQSYSLQKRGSDNSSWSYNWPSDTFVSNAPAQALWITQYQNLVDSSN
jgi:hypothetical protein